MAFDLQTKTNLLLDIQEKHEDIITQVQSDENTRYLDVNLYNNGVPLDLTGKTVRIYAIKPDEFYIFNEGEVTNATDGRCQFELTKQILAKFGYARIQISVWENEEKILNTQEFVMYIAENILQENNLQSSNEYGALVVKFQNLYQALTLLTKMINEIGTAGETAHSISVNTVWQMLEKIYTINKQVIDTSSVAEVLNRLGTKEDSGRLQTIFGRTKNIGYFQNKEGKFFAGKFQYEEPYLEQSLYKNTGDTPTNTTRTYNIATDGTHVYILISNEIFVYNLSNFSKSREHIQISGLEEYIYDTIIDGDYLYLLGQHKLYKIDKANLNIISSVQIFWEPDTQITSGGTARIDGAYIYIFTGYGTIQKIDKNTLQEIGKFIATVEQFKNGKINCGLFDSSYVYAFIDIYQRNNIDSHKLLKINKSNMTLYEENILDLSSNSEANNAKFSYCFKSGNYIFATMTSPKMHIIKINYSTFKLQKITTTNLTAERHHAFDGENIYSLAGTASNPAVKFLCRIQLENPEDYIKSKETFSQTEYIKFPIHSNNSVVFSNDGISGGLKLYKYNTVPISNAQITGYEGVNL